MKPNQRPLLPIKYILNSTDTDNTGYSQVMYNYPMRKVNDKFDLEHKSVRQKKNDGIKKKGYLVPFFDRAFL